MKEKLRELYIRILPFVKQVMLYTIIITVSTLSFIVGLYYNKFFKTEKKPSVEVNVVKNTDVNLAIDQYNNLIIIDNKTGDYVIYQDSIGHTIFTMYAKNIWGQHNSKNNANVN